jgi:hypothetical protein
VGGKDSQRTPGESFSRFLSSVTKALLQQKCHSCPDKLKKEGRTLTQLRRVEILEKQVGRPARGTRTVRGNFVNLLTWIEDFDTNNVTGP